MGKEEEWSEDGSERFWVGTWDLDSRKRGWSCSIKCCSNLIRATGRCCSLFTLRVVKGPGNETWSTVSSECERKEETGSGVLFFLAN